MSSLIRILRDPKKPIRLVRPRFFQRCIEKNEPMPCRQELPEKAFLDIESFTDDELEKRLDVISISYCRLDPKHPDPKSVHMKTIAKLLECYLTGTEEKAKKLYKPHPSSSEMSATYLKRQGYRMGAGEGKRIVGVFLDWVSIYQDKPWGRYTGDEVMRTKEEIEVSESALQHAGVFYAHRETVVWMLTYLPIDLPKIPEWTDEDGVVHPAAFRADFDSSGWPTFERRMAALNKRPGDLLNITLDKREKLLMGKIPQFEPEDGPVEWKHAWAIANGDYVRLCMETMDKLRGMPMVPSEFGDLIQTKRFFDDDAVTGDMVTVAIPQFRRAFESIIGEAEILCYADMGYSSEEAQTFLKSTIATGHCQALRTFDMSGNRIGISVESLARSLNEGAQNLEVLILSGNSGLYGNITAFSQLPKLKELHLDGTQVDGDVESLSKLQNLRCLFLRGTKVTGNIESLVALKELEEVWLSETKVGGELDSLVALKNLRKLNVWFTQVPLLGTKDLLQKANPELIIY